MSDLAKRFPENPLLLPEDVKSSAEGLRVIGLLNPGVFQLDGKGNFRGSRTAIINREESKRRYAHKERKFH